ncbi:unnamed protein product [Psylliodes chrysocephalus]|uniref:Fatty acyl-CoA reductase n=1 Tax=Psylliodes chrysocephalus TaxID=3402493 RepID=A0A9P0CHH5_9CUCU|nr:unnamed protein product [Psylliodes chrysocephala]
MFKQKSITIPEFYKGKSVFLTGGTGFVGKLIVEKLLRSCPGVKNIYILVRPKKSESVEDRVEKLKNDKVTASVRFDDFLEKAILTNVRSTAEVIDLVEQLDTVDAFIHVSTAYSNCDRKLIDERFYPSAYNWRDAIKLAESTEEDVKKITHSMTLKMIEPMPNTYVFTKGLAEDCVNERCLNRFPTCIVRPSIITPTLEEPLQGYTDNFNGPVTLFLAGGVGIAKVINLDPDNYNDQVFGDNVAKVAIIASWKHGVEKTTNEIKIYNATSDFLYTPAEGLAIGLKIQKENPLKYYFGTGIVTLIKCPYGYFVYNLLFHLFPALIMDLLLKLFGKKISILGLRRKFVISNMATLPFLMPTGGIPWKFITKNYESLESSLTNIDKKDFSYLHNRITNNKDKLEDYFRMFITKSRPFLIPFEREQASKEEIIRYRISDSDRAFLVKTVSIVFHIAASVRFDDFLQKAIISNVRSTREVIYLVEQLNKVDVFVYVSTAYSNCDRKTIDERFYKSSYDWRDAIKLAESTEEDVKKIIDNVTMKVIEPMPNTYVFTKGLAEDCLSDQCLNRFPTCVIRPSIVTPTFEEPMEGYIDNFNGPVTLFIAGGSGIAKVMHLDRDTILDHVFGDNVAKVTIIASWKHGVEKTTDEIKIYNATSDFLYTSRQSNEIGYRIQKENPLRYYMGVGPVTLMKCSYGYYVYNLLFHFFPALIIDLLLKLFGKKLSILSLRRKLVVANMALLPFTMPSGGIPWTFINKNYVGLESTLTNSDKKNFSYLHNRCKGANDDEIEEYLKMFVAKPRVFLLEGEREQASKEEIIRYKRLNLLDKTVKNAFWAFLCYLAVWKYGLLTTLSTRFYNYVASLP